MSTPIAIKRINDFVIKFANVNGSGSASANELFARAVMSMGVPTAPRNIFPSNIQGMPTWYEMRVSAAGWRGRRGGCDMMVAMNPQTWDRDVAELASGGYLFYDSTKALPRSRLRQSISQALRSPSVNTFAAPTMPRSVSNKSVCVLMV